MIAPDLTASDILALLSDPTAVFLNMLRGGIAKPSPVNIWHLYGQELADAMPAKFRPKVAREAEDDAAARSPDGWWAPIEPTEEMLDAAWSATRGHAPYPTMRKAYAAMLAAARATSETSSVEGR